MSQRYVNTPPAMTEAQWQRQVIDIARRLGWEVFHERFSYGSEPGHPDLQLWRPEGFQGKPGRSVIYAELKRETGKLTAAQEVRVASLLASGTPCFVWRPSQFDEMLEELER